MRTAGEWTIYLSFVIFGWIAACAPIISPELRAKVDPSLTFDEIVRNPNAYKGKVVLLGGEMIQILPQRDGTTVIEVLESPLERGGEPKRTMEFRGKFLVLLKGKLDQSVYQKGKKITVAGEMQAPMSRKEVEELTERDYRYPVLLSREVYVWRDYLYPYSSPPPPDRPWWYDPSERWLRF